MKKSNNLGFSLIEVIIIMAIILTATGLSAGGLTYMYRARSLKAAKIVDSMISQSKVNAMSSRRNQLELSYDADKQCYICELISKHDDNDVVYEHNEFGNQHLEIIAGGVNLQTAGGTLVLSFNMDTGAVKEFSVGGDKLTTVMTIQMNSYTDHTITLYRDTGDHSFE